MLEEMPIVTLREQEYELKPLGIADIFRMQRCVQEIGKKSADKLEIDNIDLAKVGQLSQMHQMRLLMTVIDVAEEELYKLLTTITGLDKKTLQDRNKIPADAPIKILTTFWNEHPDIDSFKSFLGNFEKKQKQEEVEEA